VNLNGWVDDVSCGGCSGGWFAWSMTASLPARP